MEKIEWNKLETKRTVENITITYTEKFLQEGIYVCPHCIGTGKVEIDHSFKDGTIYTMCVICKGTGEIRKCTVCNINSIPNDDYTSRCYDCNETYSKELRDAFDERIRIVHPGII